MTAPDHTTVPVADRTGELLLQLRAARAIIIQQQVELAAVQPLVDLHLRLMLDRATNRQLVQPFDQWLRWEVMPGLGGRLLEDPGAVADRHGD